MLYLSIAIVISVALITFFFFFIELNNTHHEVYEPIRFENSDTFDEHGDENDEFKGQMSMDEYIKNINNLMVGDDDE